MNRQRQSAKQSVSSDPIAAPKLILPGVVAIAWLLGVAVLSSRTYLLSPYALMRGLPPTLEPFGISLFAFLTALSLAWVWFWFVSRGSYSRAAIIWLLVSLVPAFPWLLEVLGFIQVRPIFPEAIWLSAWSGLSFRYALADLRWSASFASLIERYGLSSKRILLVVASCICVWWFAQACWYFDNFLLGYNDFGHFLQRLSNTLAGRGWLVESPVLPRFWDHFNPGLLALLPCWLVWPDVHQAFAWQAVALAGSGYLVYRIALQLGHTDNSATLFGLAWLAQPVVGQMNLAYTYGWHPITFVIPLLLLSIWSLLSQRYWLAALSCIIALSMEEGVFVIVALVAGWCSIGQFWQSLRKSNHPQSITTSSLSATLSSPMWFAISIAAAACFLGIYKYSGLAEFQTGRFANLGANVGEIVMSPVMRPAAFWPPLLSLDRWYFVAMLTLPCGWAALRRGWFYMVPTLLPLGVLLVWEHPPAHCIAFQYASTLLPLFWLATLTGARSITESDSKRNPAAVALVTGVILSLFVGQLPFSGRQLMDVDAFTYPPEETLRRLTTDEDGQWLTEQLRQLRSEYVTCLATGRIAAHLVGLPDLETVGQFAERRERLSKLPDRADPLRYYDVIVLDRHERFQQTLAQVKALEVEAREHGFEVIADQYDTVILRKSAL